MSPADDQPTRHEDTEPAPAAPHSKLGTPEGRRRGGQVAGKTARAVALIGAPLPVLSLKTSADRMAVLEGLLAAVAAGKTSGMTATVVTQIVKTANELARGDQEEQLRELERRIEGLVVPGR